jgi:hypothetical protein
MLSIGLCRWYINITITILDSIHRPVGDTLPNASCRSCLWLRHKEMSPHCYMGCGNATVDISAISCSCLFMIIKGLRAYCLHNRLVTEVVFSFVINNDDFLYISNQVDPRHLHYTACDLPTGSYQWCSTSPIRWRQISRPPPRQKTNLA